MKQYVFSPIDNSYKISYLTNGIVDNDRLFINEIKSEKAGVVTTGLITEAKALHFPHDYVETTEKILYAFAVANGLNLEVYEDRHAMVNLNETLSNFLTFSVDHQSGAAVIDHTAKTIAINVANGSTVTDLKSTFTVTNGATVKIGATAQVSGTTENDFTGAVTYIVTSHDTTAHIDYVVTVTVL